MNGPALYQAILDDPDDDLARLVYADWLDENGQPERAELIRVQCELAGLPPPERGCEGQVWGCYAEPPCRGCRLRRREKLLLNHWWAPQDALPADYVERGSFRWSFRRGFPAVVRLRLAAWMEHGQALVRAHPLERVELSDRAPRPCSKGYGWWMRTRNLPLILQHEELPAALWGRLPPGRERYHWCAWYDSPEEALDALSAACLGWARAATPAG